MSISVTKKSEQNSTFNPLKWAAIGAGGGLLTKEFFPILDNERQMRNYSEVRSERRAFVRSETAKELNQIRHLAKDAKGEEKIGYDLYYKYAAPPGSTKETREAIMKGDFQRLSDSAKKVFNSCKDKLDTLVKETKHKNDLVYDAVIKHLRPTKYFVLIGALAGVGISFVSYVLAKMSNEA